MSELESIAKLREYAAYNCRVKGWKDDLKALADAIEAEIRRDYMRLPLDADNVPIRMGDTVEGELLYDNATVKGTVTAYHIHGDDELGTVYIRVKPTEDTWTIKELQFRRCRHVKSKTLEDTLREMLDRNGDGVGLREFNRDFDAFVKHYADEIRAMFGEVDYD